MVADLKNTQDVAIRNPITGEYAETGGPTDPVNVIGLSDSVTITPTLTTNPAYSIGDSMGGKQTLTYFMRVVGGTATLLSIHIMDKSNTKPQLDIIFFDSDPTAATLTDNAGFVYSTDSAKEIAKIQIFSSEYSTTNGIASLSKNLGLGLQADAATKNIYVGIVTQTGVTMLSASDFKIDLSIYRD